MKHFVPEYSKPKLWGGMNFPVYLIKEVIGIMVDFLEKKEKSIPYIWTTISKESDCSGERLWGLSAMRDHSCIIATTCSHVINSQTNRD